MGAITVSRAPFIVVVSGPSGVGKSTIVTRLLEAEKNLCRSISFTTRPARGSEQNGGDYRFVSPDEFIRRRETGEFLEWAEVHGNLYGTPAAFVDERLASGSNVVLEIDVQGGMSVKGKRPDSVLVFLLPPGIEELERRLRVRGTDKEEVVRGRLKNAKHELEYYAEYDYVVVNDEVERCVADVRNILRAESLRLERTSI